MVKRQNQRLILWLHTKQVGEGSLITGTSTKNLLRPASRACKWGNYITDIQRNFQEFLPSERENLRYCKDCFGSSGQAAKGRKMLFSRFMI